jgi:hypothetical protein
MVEVAYCKQDEGRAGGRRRLRAGRWGAAGLVVVVALLGAGCGDSEDDAADSDPPASEESTSSTSAESTSSTADEGGTPGDDAAACASDAVAEAAALPDDFGEPEPGRGGAGEGAEPEECVFSATSNDNAARHVTFGTGASPYGMADPTELPNGARRSEIEDGFAAEVDVEGGEVVHVLGYGMTPDEFDGVASSL